MYYINRKKVFKMDYIHKLKGEKTFHCPQCKEELIPTYYDNNKVKYRCMNCGIKLKEKSTLEGLTKKSKR